MGVTDETPKVIHNWDGTTDPLAFSFLIYEDSDLIVTKVTISDGTEEVMELTTDYTVTLTGTAPSAGYIEPVASGDAATYKIVIQRSIPQTQEVTLTDTEATPAATYIEAFDRAVMLIQQLQEQIDRSLKASITSTADYTLPAPVAGNVLGWNDDADDFVNYEPNDGAYLTKASTAQAQAGTDDDTYMTPAKTSDAITALQTAKASQAEAQAMTNDTKFMTPARTLDSINTTKLLVSVNVNITAGMTAAQIQALIDAQPKNLNGYNISFLFADATYTLTSQLLFNGFKGGTVFIKGNTGESGLHTNQAVVLDGSASSLYPIAIYNCDRVDISNIKVMIKTDAASWAGIICYQTRYLYVTGCYILGNGTTYGHGILLLGSTASIDTSYFSNTLNGIWTSTSHVYSNGNDDTGTAPAYGLASTAGSTIGKNGTQPAGSTSNESATTGGVIR